MGETVIVATTRTFRACGNIADGEVVTVCDRRGKFKAAGRPHAYAPVSWAQWESKVYVQAPVPSMSDRVLRFFRDLLVGILDRRKKK